MLKEGQQVGNLKIVQIAKDSVRIRIGGQDFRVNLSKKEEEKR
jgi:hypothetical protein